MSKEALGIPLRKHERVRAAMKLMELRSNSGNRTLENLKQELKHELEDLEFILRRPKKEETESDCLAITCGDGELAPN